MKAEIHPELFECKVSCSGCGTEFTTFSTRSEIRVEVCSQCHPFFTGKQARIVDTEGRVEKFVKKFEGKEARVSKRKRKQASAEAEKAARLEREARMAEEKAEEEKALREEARKKRAEERAARQAAQAKKEESVEAEAAPVAEDAAPDPEPNDAEAVVAAEDVTPDPEPSEAEAVTAMDDPSSDASPAPQPAEEGTEAVHPVIYEKLKEVAKSGKTEYYTPIGKLADLDMKKPDHRRKIGQILDAISRHEHKAGRPLLSVVVVAKATDKMSNKRPRKGFFDLARELNLIQAGDDEDSFFIEELNKVYEAWR